MKIFLGFGPKSFPSLLFILSQKVTVQHNCSNAIFFLARASSQRHGGKTAAPPLPFLLSLARSTPAGRPQGRAAGLRFAALRRVGLARKAAVTPDFRVALKANAPKTLIAKILIL